MTYAAAHKGIWIDEAWSQFFDRHDLSLEETYRQRWSTDVHPPGFYLFGWLFEPLTGESIFAKRLLNLLPLGLVLEALRRIARRRPESSGALLVAACLFIASPLPIDYFLQHRAYFMIACALLVANAAVATIAQSVTDYRGEDRGLAAILAAAILVALNLQYLCAFLAAVGLTVQAALLAVRGKRRWALIVLAAIAAGNALLLVQAAAQAEVLTYFRVHFWARTTMGEALVALASAIGLTSVGAAVALGFAATHRRRPSDAVLLCLAAVVAIAVAALALNALRPVIIRQYISPLVPALIVAIGFAAAPIVRRPRWFVASLALGLAIVAVYAVIRSRVQDMEANAAFIAIQHRACPALTVIGVPPWTAGNSSAQPAAARDMVPSAFAALGRRYGFEMGKGDPARCPTLLWAENAVPPTSPLAFARTAGVAITPGQAAGATLHTSGTGFVMSYPPRR